MIRGATLLHPASQEPVGTMSHLTWMGNPVLSGLARGRLDPLVWPPYEGGEVSDLGGAHLHEVNLEALTWERQLPKMKIMVSKTRYCNSFFICLL